MKRNNAEMQTLRATLPLIVLALLLFSGAFFAFFETIYLGDQYAAFGESRIAMWTWAFRGITAVLLLGSLFFAALSVKRFLP